MAEETKLKVGDLLICHTKLVMNYSYGSDIRTTVGKSYRIIKILYEYSEEPKLVIINDNNGEHRISFNIYTNWFYNLKEERRKKLKKIQDVESW